MELTRNETGAIVQILNNVQEELPSEELLEFQRNFHQNIADDMAAKLQAVQAYKVTDPDPIVEEQTPEEEPAPQPDPNEVPFE